MKIGLTFLLCGFISFLALSQDPKMADSLLVVYETETGLHDSTKEDLLQQLSFHQTDVDKKLKYAEALIELSTSTNSLKYLYAGYFLKGNALRLKGDLNEALTAYLSSINYALELNDQAKIGEAYLVMGDVYSVNGNHQNSTLYYNKAINILRNGQDSISLASALLNAGDEYFNANSLDSALIYFQESGKIFELKKYETGKAYNLGNVGMVYAEQGLDELAETNINAAIAGLEKLENYYPISVYLTFMSNIYLRKDDVDRALTYSNRSLELATTYGLKEQISEANLQLSKLYEQIGNTEESYQYYKNHIAYRDSVNNLETVQQLADLRTDFEVSQKQAEVDLLNEQKRSQQILLIASIVVLLLIFILSIVLYRRYVFLKKTNLIIEAEKERSESLLLNILPREIAQELKENGKVQAIKFDSVTVLFTDFQEFTKVAELAQPEQLVKSIDFYFKAFDEITTKYGLEKIKTIGDSYMCAAGLPTVTKTHAKTIIRAAQDIMELVNSTLNNQDGLLHFETRIGLHTGPVVAGIVGIKKWQYDVWGDTVNIASKMETMSESGKINLSETTYNEIKDEFPCEYRGEIEVKNRGSLKMYFLS